MHATAFNYPFIQNNSIYFTLIDYSIPIITLIFAIESSIIISNPLFPIITLHYS